MAEQLYTIPVHDAFAEDCECPLCLMHRDLEQSAIEFTMGPSYMEDDNREVTDKLGFCTRHLEKLYGNKNRLGLALMLKTHTDKTIRDIKELAAKGPAGKSGFLKKSTDAPVIDYIKELEASCFVCQRVERLFTRYIDTIFHMWKKEEEFKQSVKECKGFCTLHYGMLYKGALKELSGASQEEFLSAINQAYIAGMERVNGDVSWFIDKFDYRNQDAPWKNSKDALPRALIKVGHTIVE